MAQLTYREAVARGIAQEMRRDPTVVFLGEDVGGAGGVFKTTSGLLDEFGPVRVVDTPISEQAILGDSGPLARSGAKLRVGQEPGAALVVMDHRHLEERLNDLVGKQLLGEEREVGDVLGHRLRDPATGVADHGRLADLQL